MRVRGSRSRDLERGVAVARRTEASLTARSIQDVAERVTTYEAAVARLESIRGDYVRRKPLYAKGFIALTTAGFACFAFGGLAGLWGSISATFISVSGYALLHVRLGELKDEIDALRGEVERMRGIESQCVAAER